MEGNKTGRGSVGELDWIESERIGSASFSFLSVSLTSRNMRSSSAFGSSPVVFPSPIGISHLAALRFHFLSLYQP